MKRFLKPLLMLVALIAACIILNPTKAHAATTSDLAFTLNGDGASYSITDCRTSATGKLTIPSTYNGKPITTIGNGAFLGCSSLTSVTIPASITAVGDNAFWLCTSLESVHITDIAAWCKIDFGSSYANPMNEAENLYLNGKPVTNVVIPDGVTSIKCTFMNCSSLTSVTIPDSVTTIGFYAFSGCEALTSVIIPDSVTYISSAAFMCCISLTDVVIPYGVTHIQNNAFFACNRLTSIFIPDSVTYIGPSAFDHCNRLTSVRYSGTRNQWKAITKGNNNAPLLNATLVFTQCESKGHTKELLPGKAPTCIETGLTDGKICSVCEVVLQAQEIIPVGDHAGAVVPGKPATCTETGLTEGKKCSVCDKILVAQEVLPVSHKEVVIPGKKATCIKTGLTDGKICGVCEAVLQAQEIIPVGDHAEVLIPGEPATCIASGISDGVGCEDCGEILVYPEEIPALGHTKAVVPGYAPTCTATGLTDGEECSACGKVFVKQSEIPAVGHTEESVPGYTPTCAETGLTEGKKCAVCNKVLLEQSVIPTIDHTEAIFPGYAPTCAETGLTDGKKCSVCGEILLEQETVSAAGHTEEIIPMQAPACTETGLTEGKKCTACGEILLVQEEIPAIGHTYDNEFDESCNICDNTRTTTGSYQFINYRVVFSDEDETHSNHRAIIYKLGDKTVTDPTDEAALQAIDSSAVTKWGVGDINKILLTDAGNYVVLLKYNVGTGAAVKVPMVLHVSADPKLIINKNNKITAIDDDPTNLYHRVVVYYLGDETVEDIYDEAALKAIDAEAKTVWNIRDINRIALTKGGNYVLHLCYNKAGSNKITVAQQFTVFAIPTVKIDNNNKLVVTEENADNRNHRVTVFFLGEGTVEDPFDETEVKEAAISSKTYWGIAAINKVELKAGGNYVIHLYYNVGTSEKRTLALDLTLNERPELSVDENGKISVCYTDPEINNPRAYIYNVGDADIDDIYNEAALKAITTPMQLWGLNEIQKRTLTPGTYVIHFCYNVGTSAKKTVALKITI